jgi:hypothetical protein
MVQDFQIFSPVTEAINGRAAMLGFAVAVVSEVSQVTCLASQTPSHSLRTTTS